MEQELIPGLPDDIAIDCIARVPLRHHAGIRPVSRRWRDLIASPFLRRHRCRISAAEDLFFLVQADSITLLPPTSQTQVEESKDVTFEGGEDGDVSKRSDGSPRTPGYGLTVYNVTLGEWRRATPPPVAVPMFAQCAAGESKIVLAGGWDPTTFEPVARVHVLDPMTGACRRGKDSPAARSFSAAASISGGNKILIAGGHDSQKNALKSADMYDPDLDTWQNLPEMAEERDECRGLTACDGKFIAISGYGTENQGRFNFSAELFDFETNQWIKEENFWGEEQQQGSGGAVACFSVEGKIYYIDCSSSESGRGVREWDNNGVWKNFAAVPEGMKTGARAAAVIGDKVFVTTADVSGYAAWIFELKKKKWTKIETPPAFSGFVYSASALRL